MARRSFTEPGTEDPISFAVSQRDRSILQMVREALDRNRAMLAFQPVVAAASGKPAFHEGLIRLLDSTGRVIPAAQFMSVVEMQELGREIDCAALRLGLGTLARVPGLRLSINVSARSIGYPRWTQILRKWLKRDERACERLILEINESSALQVPELLKPFMADLQNKGITFALDDFGAAKTSFRDLKDFYFDIMKIDGSFVRGCHGNADNQCILHAMAAIGREFDMYTVAERVETREEADFLVRAGIDCLQGYLYGAPEIASDWLPAQDRRRTG